MSDEIETPEVEVIPEPTVFELYRCRVGHEQRGSGETVATNEGFGSVSTGPMCVQCWMASLGKRFRTKKVSE